MKKVKILKQVGMYTTGQIAEVSDEEFVNLVAPRSEWDGEKAIQTRAAMPLEDWEAAKAAPLDKGGMTQGELEALGAQNIVETPKDPAFEKKLQKMMEPLKVKGKKQSEQESA